MRSRILWGNIIEIGQVAQVTRRCDCQIEPATGDTSAWMREGEGWFKEWMKQFACHCNCMSMRVPRVCVQPSSQSAPALLLFRWHWVNFSPSTFSRLTNISALNLCALAMAKRTLSYPSAFPLCNMTYVQFMRPLKQSALWVPRLSEQCIDGHQTFMLWVPCRLCQFPFYSNLLIHFKAIDSFICIFQLKANQTIDSFYFSHAK